MVFRVLFSAGDFSGDEHLSRVLQAMRIEHPEVEFRGMAGPSTRALGVGTELALEDFAALMGFVDVVKASPRIFAARRWFKRAIAEWKPNLLIIVDYPDFNLRLARMAKSAGVKVLYYIPPKVWAWRAGRIQAIERLVDKTALIFPFEKPFYKQHGHTRTSYVGHPFSSSLVREDDTLREQQLRREFLEAQELDPERPVVAFFPGSRAGEIRRHWDGMLAGLAELHFRMPQIQVLLSVAAPVRQMVNELVAKSSLAISVAEEKNLEILRFSDVGFVKSGTSNLQAAFYELPFVMYYQAGLLAEIIVRLLVKIKEFSIVNIIRPGTIRELLQKDATPQKIADELERLLKEPARSHMKAQLREVHKLLGSCDEDPLFDGCRSAPERAARLALSLLR